MKVLLFSRLDNSSQPGGDSIHLHYTARYLEKIGVKCTIWQGGNIEPLEYDIIHFFNLNRPAALLKYLSKKHPPIVCSSIYIDYQQADFDQKGLRAFLSSGLGPHAMEYLKTLARAYKFKSEKISTAYLLDGHAAAIQKILDNSSYLITSSNAERDIIAKSFDIKNLACSAIPLGIEHLPPVKNQTEKNGIICVARFEPLKNQKRLIEACQILNESLILVGEHSRAHEAYFKECKKVAQGKIHFYGPKRHEETVVFMSKAKVHVLASHYETTGLASLEALLSGCQIVVNDHPIQRELFGDRAHYCDPLSSESIAQAISEALVDSRDHRPWLKENFSWQKKAAAIKEVYAKVLRA